MVETAPDYYADLLDSMTDDQRAACVMRVIRDEVDSTRLNDAEFRDFVRKGLVTLAISYGNLAGKYFTQWRIDDLRELAEKLFSRKATKLHICYDPAEDYHILTCKINGHDVSVHYYKVFRLTVDGEVICRFPKWDIHELAWKICDVCLNTVNPPQGTSNESKATAT